MFKVEKFVAEPRRARGHTSVIPFADLKEKGDSFFVPGTMFDPLNVKMAAHRFSIKHSVELSTFKVDGGCRVFRK